MADKILRLQALLTDIGWSGAELMRRVGCSQSTVYKWLNGEARTPGSVIAYLNLVLETREAIRKLGELSDGKPHKV